MSADERPHTPLWTLKACQLLGAAAWACYGRFINVFWSDIGVTRAEIGALSLATMIASFIGQLFWSMVTDRLGEYKRVLVGTMSPCRDIDHLLQPGAGCSGQFLVVGSGLCELILFPLHWWTNH